MDTNTTEILVHHADRLNKRTATDGELMPKEGAELRPLMTIAEQLKETMVPIEPSATFVRTLGQELREAAQQQQKAARRLRRGMVIGAAALGSALSVAGVVTLIVRRRRSHVPS